MNFFEVIIIGPFYMILAGIIAAGLRPLELILPPRAASAAQVIISLTLAGVVVWVISNPYPTMAPY